ncbi:hypothetical protein PHYPO_G00091030, partial [Pangasianodon hypophthalmus]
MKEWWIYSRRLKLCALRDPPWCRLRTSTSCVTKQLWSIIWRVSTTMQHNTVGLQLPGKKKKSSYTVCVTFHTHKHDAQHSFFDTHAPIAFLYLFFFFIINFYSDIYFEYFDVFINCLTSFSSYYYYYYYYYYLSTEGV